MLFTGTIVDRGHVAFALIPLPQTLKNLERSSAVNYCSSAAGRQAGRQESMLSCCVGDVYSAVGGRGSRLLKVTLLSADLVGQITTKLKIDLSAKLWDQFPTQRSGSNQGPLFNSCSAIPPQSLAKSRPFSRKSNGPICRTTL